MGIRGESKGARENRGQVEEAGETCNDTAVIYRFGEFTLDAGRYELRRGAEVLAAEPKVLETLACLAARPGRVVTKEELLEDVWEGRFVGDAAISRAVREVRKLLGDTGKDSRWIKTVYGRGYRFDAEVAAGEPAEGPAPPPGDRRPAAHRLPRPLTSLVGRETEIAAVSDLLAASRLVTLTGAAGTGKSRLALAVAEAVAARFPDGVCFVPLAELEDPAAVLPAVVRALGLTDAAGESTLAALQMQLRDRRVLLVLDNFERLLPAAGEVLALLRACPETVALVTSRFVLQVEGEQEFPVPPLGLSPGEPGGDGVGHAVELFLERARAVLPSFDPTPRELDYVGEICRRLDGLPLAIEWAAARIKVFPPRALWERLAGRLDLLGSPGRSGARPAGGLRHRTLHEAIAWSAELLPEEESKLLRRLAVFAGGFPLSAVDAVCGPEEPACVELLTALVDKSLVERDPAAEPRFRLLETTREYARERLEEAGEEAEVRRAHARWALSLAVAGRDALVGGEDRERSGGGQASWLSRLDADYANLLAAMDWSRRRGEPETAVLIGVALAPYWSARGLYREGWKRLHELMEEETGPALRADLLSSVGLLGLLRCDYRQARELLERAREILETSGDGQPLARVLDHLAWIGTQIEPSAEAETLARRAMAIHESLGDRRGVAVGLNNLGHLAFFRGDAAAAEARFAESLVRRREIGDQRGTAFALINLAMTRLVRPEPPSTDDQERAEGWLGEAHEILEELADPPLESWLVCMEALLDLTRGAAREAARRLAEHRFAEAEIAHPDGIAWAASVSAEVAEAVGDGPAAEARFTEAYEIWHSIGSVWGRAFGALRLAEHRLRQGDREGARELYREAAEIAGRWGLAGIAQACRGGDDGHV